mmetsp:Transcript_60287/g.171361  ORF Transcript_60287/g.171361 Transcript_60287/m.171361 type:complete len:540 (-) Transcript_60287:117-1736(-)
MPGETYGNQSSVIRGTNKSGGTERTTRGFDACTSQAAQTLADGHVRPREAKPCLRLLPGGAGPGHVVGPAALLGHQRGHDHGDRGRHLLSVVDGQALVGAVHVRAWPEDACAQQGRLGEHLAEHVHQGDGATDADQPHLPATEDSLAGLGESGLQVRPRVGSVPARRHVPGEVGGHVRAVGRVPLQGLLEGLSGRDVVDQRGDPEGQLHLDARVQHVAGPARGRQPLEAHDGHARLPDVGLVHPVHVVDALRLCALPPGETPAEVRPPHGLRGRLHLLLALDRDLRLQLRQQDPARRRVLHPSQELPRDAEGVRHNASPETRMQACPEQAHLECAHDDAPERRCHPQRGEVLRHRVHAEHRRGNADPRGQLLHVVAEVRGAGLLRGLKDDDYTRVLDTQALQNLHGNHARVDGVAVVSGTSTIELAILDQPRGRADVWVPARPVWLLVEVAVHDKGHGRLLGALRATNLGDHEGAEARVLQQLHRAALHALRIDPVHCVGGYLVQKPVRLPVWVVGGGEVRNAHKLLQRGDRSLEFLLH